MNETPKEPKLDDDFMKKAQKYNEEMRKGRIIKTIFFSIAGLIILIYMMGGFDSCSSKSSHSSSNNINATCYYYSQRLVKEKLKSPKSAEFPSYSDNFAKKNGNTITISAYVDAENSFGVSIRTNYIATIEVKDGKPVNGSVTLLK